MNKKLVKISIFILLLLLAILSLWFIPILSVFFLLLDFLMIAKHIVIRNFAKRKSRYLQYVNYIHNESRDYSELIVGSTDAEVHFNFSENTVLNYTEFCRSFTNDFNTIKNYFSAVKNNGCITHIISVRDVVRYRNLSPIDANFAISPLLTKGQTRMNKKEKIIFAAYLLSADLPAFLQKFICFFRGKIINVSDSVIDNIINQCSEEKLFCKEREVNYRVILETSGVSSEIYKKLQRKLINANITVKETQEN